MRIKPLLLLNLTGAAILLSWFWPWLLSWTTIDEQIFWFFNQYISDEHQFFIHLLAILDSDVFDAIALLIMVGLFWWAMRCDPRPNAGRRWFGLAVVLLLTASAMVLFAHYGIRTDERPIQVHELASRLADVVSVPIPAGHGLPGSVGSPGLLLMIFAAFMWRFAERRVGLCSLVFVVMASSPRIIAGAYWFSDVYMDSLSLVLVVLPWILCTPVAARVAGWFARQLGLVWPGSGPPRGGDVSSDPVAGWVQGDGLGLVYEGDAVGWVDPAAPGGDNVWATLGRRAEFSTLERVFTLEGRIVTRDSLSQVLYKRINDLGYYIKRYYRGGRGLRSWFGVPRVKREWDNLVYFRRLRLPTLELEAFGGERRYGRFVRGALVTQELPDSRDLLAIARSADGRLADPHWRRQVSRQIADGLSVLHARRFCHGDIRWRNLLITGGTRPRVHFFDCPAGRFWVGPFLAYRRIKDLAYLDEEARIYLSRTQRLRFYLRYRGCGKLSPGAKSEIRKVIAYNDRRA